MRLRYTPAAIADMQDIRDYIRDVLLNPEAAQSILAGIAASCAFTTPVATPPNTLILGPGKFRFMDYVKVGLPLVVVSMIVCTVIIPLVWPF